MIRNLFVTTQECNVWITLEDMMVEPDAGWRWLAKPLRPQDRDAFMQPYRVHTMPAVLLIPLLIRSGN
jgi:hypothetical protein